MYTPQISDEFMVRLAEVQPYTPLPNVNIGDWVVWINSRTTPELMQCWTKLLPASPAELKTQAELFAWASCAGGAQNWPECYGSLRLRDSGACRLSVFVSTLETVLLAFD